jgi:ABC-type transporter Mla subunit MlaD
MIEETGDDEGSADLSGQTAATSATPKGMAEALDAVRASSPSLGAALDAANVTPGKLADAHDRATSEEPDADHTQS